METKKKLINYFKNLDYVIIAIVLITAVIGLFSIYSATKSISSGQRQMIVQISAMIIGIIFMFLLASIDYEDFSVFTRYIYGASILILLFVLIFGEGKEETGANSWIRFAGVGIQPSELVKIAFAITFSAHLSRVKNEINKPKTLLMLFIHFFVLTALVIIQNDTGTALVFTFMFISMLFAAGLSLKYFFAGIISVCAVIPILWQYVLQPYQKNRILVFLNPELDASGAGYQVLQSKIAIGSGQFFGRGFLNGPQNQLSLLPEKDTDFIFGVVGEELGFIGTISVLLLLVIIIARCIVIAKKAKTDMGRFICVGIGSMLFFHTFENICMCIGLLPVTGIPLPFISYGGSSVLTNFIAVGLVLSVYANRKKINFGL